MRIPTKLPQLLTFLMAVCYVSAASRHVDSHVYFANV
jgi:hypothetical protein